MKNPVGWTDRALTAHIHDVVVAYPDNIAIHTPDRSLTYRELDQHTNRIANALLKLGIARDVPVGLFLSHGIPAITGLLGTLKAGHFYFGLDPTYPAAHNSEILRQAEPQVVITSAALRDSAEALIAGGDAPSILELETLLESGADTDPEIDIVPEDNALLMFVMSEGVLRGVLTQHKAQVYTAFSWIEEFGLTAADRYSHLLSYSLSVSRTELFLALVSGAAIHPYSLRERGLQGVGEWFIQERITCSALVPGIFRGMVRAFPEGTMLSDLRYLWLVGEPLTPADVDLFRACTPRSSNLVNFYGAAETGTISTFTLTADTPLPESTVPVGFALAGREILLVDDDARILPAGQTGEIAVRSSYLARGYWGMEMPPPGTFIADPLGSQTPVYLTGDRGYFDAQGRLNLAGRQDAQIKIRGYRVLPEEVRKVLSEHPAVREAAVFDMDDARGEKRLVAYLVPDPAHRVSAADLREYLGLRMPQYNIPSHFVFRDDLPRTATGKVDQRALIKPDSSRPDLPVPYARPRDGLESQLTGVWEEVVGIYPVGINDDFFDLGGHSLLALELFARIESKFGRALPMNALFDASTIAGFADILRRDADQNTSETLIALQPEGSKPPLFMIHPAGGHILSYYHLVRHLDADQPVYGLQARGLDGREAPHETVEAMAGHYLAEIRRVQPQGPYRIVGYSMGGKIAYEIARRLEGEGDRPEFLILLDTFFGQHTTEDAGFGLMAAAAEPEEAPHGNVLNALRRDWKAMHAMTFRARVEYIVSQTRNRWRWHVLRRLRGDQALNNPDRWTPARRVQEACHVANGTYQPGRYGGSLIFIRAASKQLEESPALWGEVIDGEVQIIDVEATHRSMMEEPVVQTLAKHLHDLLV